jgi:2-polyprenyl-6-hydroxyphenyl methylase/3-demethylubiquinone-9 3-methyltransferase
MHPSVQYHESLASHWENRYEKKSFQSRHAVLGRCLAGIDLASTTWLDAGCGTGTLARVLSGRGATVLGADASPAMIDIARRFSGTDPRLSFTVVDKIETIEQPPASFDGILCSSVIEYLDSPKDALATFSRLLRPSGHLICSVPNRYSLLRSGQRLVARLWYGVFDRRVCRYLEFSKNPFTAVEFSSLLQEHGFTVTKQFYFGGFLPAWLPGLAFWQPLIMFVAVHSKEARTCSR